MPITYEGGREFLAGRWTHFSVHSAAPALESNEIRTVARQARVMSNTGRTWQPDSDLTFALPVDHEDIVAIGAWDDSGAGNFLGYIVLAEPVVFSDTNSRTLEVPASLLQLQVEDSAEVTNAGVAVLYGLTERGPSDNLYASLHQSALVGGELGLGAELQTADSPGYARQSLALDLAGTLTRAVNTTGIQWRASGTWTVEPAYIGIYDALTGGNLLYSFRQNFPALLSSGGTFTINGGDLELNMQRGLSMAADVVSPSAPLTQDEIEDFALTTVPGAEVPARRLRGTTLVGLIEALTAGDRLDYESLKNQADLSLFFDGARISGTSLILIREDGQELRLQLPSSDVMADGVVTAAEVDVNTKRVTLTTSTGDTVVFDLSPFLLAVDQRFTEALATKLEGIAEGAQVNESIDMLFDDARIENNVLILTRVNDADIRLDLGDDTDLTGFFNNARVVNNNIIFTRQGRPELVVALPAQQGGGIATVETNNYITGSGTVADPVELDDDALFRDWIGGTDAAVAASGPYEGTASADPGNYNWRDVTGASGALWSGNRATLPRRFQGSAAFMSTQFSGAGPIAFRLQIRDQSNAVLGNLKFNDTSSDTRTFDVEVPIGTTSISGRLQVQGAGRYTANWQVTNVRFHSGDGILKDEIQAEIHAGTEHLTDNAFVSADFESFNRNLTLHRDGGENQVVNIPEADVSDFFDTAEINGGVLRLTREDNTVVNLTLPTGTAVADGVVTSATLDPATKIVTITTSTGDTVALNLERLALATDFGDVFENVQVIGNQLRFERFSNADEVINLNNFPDNVVGAEINSGVLTLTQFDGTTIDLTLPTGTAVADGVVTSATLDPATRIVTITTSRGDTVALNLSALALASELPSSGQLVPAGGTTDQILSKASGTDYDTEWVDAPEGGGGGNATHLVGQGNFNVTSAINFATEANSTLITLDDSDWFWVSVRIENRNSAYARVNGDEWRSTQPSTYGTVHAGTAGIGRGIYVPFSEENGSVRTLILGRTSGNRVLVGTSNTFDDPMPLVIYGENEATGGGTGGGDGLTEVATDNFVVGTGTTEDPVELNDDALFDDWIGDFDTPVAASAVFTGQVGAMPGNYSWRTVVIAVATPSMAATTQVRRLRGTAHFQELSQSGGAPVAYRVRFRNQAGTILGNAKFDDPGGDTAQIDIEIPVGTTGVSGLLQVQGAGQYRANVRFTNMRFHDGAGRLKDEIQAEIHEGTQHLTDNAFVGAEFAPVNRNLTFHRDGGVDQVVNIPEADVSDFFNGASINLGILTFNQADGTSIALTLPTGTAVADGVVTSATLNATTKTVRIVTSTGDTVNLNLADMAALRELERWAQVGNTALVPDSKIDAAIARVSALPRTGQLIPAGGTGGQVLSKTSSQDYDTTWVNGGGSTGSGNTTHLVGQGNFDVTSGNSYATEANSADITWDDSDWFLVAVGGDGTEGAYTRLRGDDIRGLTAQDYGAVAMFAGSVAVPITTSRGATTVMRFGRTANNKVLVTAVNTSADPTPLTIRGENEATGGGTGGGTSGGGSGNTTHLVGQGDFDASGSGFATEANSADITLDDSDWFLVSARDNDYPAEYIRVRGDEWRALNPKNYGDSTIGEDDFIGFIASDSGLGAAFYYLGRTSDNKILLGSTNEQDDAMPLVVRGENEATPPTFLSLPETPNTPGSPGQSLIWNPAGDALVNADRGEAGVVRLESVKSTLPIGPVRQTTRGIVPDDTATLPNLTTFTLPLATAGRDLEDGVTVATDNNSIRLANAGYYFLHLDLEAEASVNTGAYVAPSGNAVIRAEGVIQVLQNGEVVARGVMSYARYGGWQVDGIGGAPIVAEAGDVISLATHVRRVDGGIGSLEWDGTLRLVHQYVTGNALPGAGVESETINNMRVLTQAQYDAIASPDAGTYYIISG